MNTFTWQLQNPIDAVIFDCDSTLTTIEGVDELARINGVEDIIVPITAKAMGQSGINLPIYEKRLELIYPTEEQVVALGDLYFAHQTPDAYQVVQLLKHLNKAIYVISSGLAPSVKIFAEKMGIPHQHVFAVDVQFDAQGLYLDFDRSSPLVNTDGKRHIIDEIKKIYNDIVYIGDGLNDLAVKDLVTRFIGYGGVCYRENIAARCQFYLSSASLAPLLPLSLTSHEYAKLTHSEQAFYQKGLAEIEENKVEIRT